MFETTRRRTLRWGAIAVGGFALAGRGAAQPEEEEEEDTGALLDAKGFPTINPGSRGLVPVTVAFDPGVGTSPSLIDSLVLGPLRAEPEHAAHVEHFRRIRSGRRDEEDAWKVHFDPKTAVVWFQPGDTEAFVQTTVDPILRDEDPVRVVGGEELPDLVPTEFSRSGGDLIATVENQGTLEAGASTTQVDFGSHGTDQQPTSALDPGASEELAFGIPDGCFDSDCEFTITVDAADDVEESSEGNNDLAGTFIG